jgi:dihydroorotase-like cyclic amidohydrolase
MPGVETLGTLLYSEGVATGRIDLKRLVQLVSSGPAAVFGFASKGRLEPGADADFVVFDPDAAWQLDETEMHHAVGWSPYHGRDVRGRVVSTWLRGRCVYREGQVVADPGAGRFLRPS